MSVPIQRISFRRTPWCPNHYRHTSRLVRKSWPPDMIGEVAEHGIGIEVELIQQCAPENWVVRRSVSRFENLATSIPNYRGTSACDAVKIISLKHTDSWENFNVLDVLPVLLEYMDNDRRIWEIPGIIFRLHTPRNRRSWEVKYTMDLLQRRDAEYPQTSAKSMEHFSDRSGPQSSSRQNFVDNLRAAGASESSAKITPRL